MSFNRYQWECYLKAGGEKTVKRFKRFLDGELDDYPKLVRELVEKFCPDEDIVNYRYEDASAAVAEIKTILQEEETEKQSIVTLTGDAIEEKQAVSVYQMLEESWNEFIVSSPKRKTQRVLFFDFIPLQLFTTQIWCFLEPETFFPYYYQGCYHVLAAIADMFEIELPAIPGKTHYLDRILYYGDLCKIFTDFADENGMSPEELYAFLYEYAPACIGGTEWVIEDIPEPRSIFVFGYGADYPEDTPERKWIWQGNPNMQPGDVGLLYHWAPDSCFTSVWRAISPGFYDPLGIHDRYVCYGNPIKIPCVTYADLKADPVFKETSLVKQNMLRMDGAPMLPSEYMHLLEIARRKGEVPANVPVFELRKEIQHSELFLERDVEIRLLEPLLLRLGWKPENWCRQMPVRVGRGISKYPDYVINPIFAKYNERGDIILEAKLSISNNKQFEQARGQANSYAKLLGAKAFVLVAKEGIWIATKDNHFSDNVMFTWPDLENEDMFSKVYNIIGNKQKIKKVRKKREQSARGNAETLLYQSSLMRRHSVKVSPLPSMYTILGPCRFIAPNPLLHEISRGGKY